MPPRSLISAYERHLAAHGFENDPAQRALVERLQRLSDELVEHGDDRRFAKLFRRRKRKPGAPAVKGVYVWGNVGRGKTFLLDLFFQHLPIQRKRRVHFYEFMRETHALLAEIKQTRDPLEKIAWDFAEHTRLLCLDEFHVTDIGDAMILAELLKHLLGYGVVPAITSNSPPQELYRDGLQRQRFLPAIALLEERLDVIELGVACDYRLRFLSGLHLYNVPADEAAERRMETNFRRIVAGRAEENLRFRVNGREITAKQRAGGVAWFDFAVICGGPLSAADYLEIARCHEVVLVSRIPLFDKRDDVARRFISMIDTFYDRRVRLIASAADAPDRLYRRGALAQEFRRTASRLIEMQSPDYVTQARE